MFIDIFSNARWNCLRVYVIRQTWPDRFLFWLSYLGEEPDRIKDVCDHIKEVGHLIFCVCWRSKPPNLILIQWRDSIFSRPEKRTFLPPSLMKEREILRSSLSGNLLWYFILLSPFEWKTSHYAMKTGIFPFSKIWFLLLLPPSICFSAVSYSSYLFYK